MLVDRGPDEERRQKSENICLQEGDEQFQPVSYTHLTLPTNREV